ncbi:MAG: hypothetical protein OXR82_11030 [Gammaproteobacteria bacterium]|nr:hypothetical protein [Gammaproteobacteria bacterium]MDE0258899.1 hypothetical protein [Gammaproteobacteria bacterium]
MSKKRRATEGDVVAEEKKRVPLPGLSKADLEKVRREGEQHARDMASIGHNFLLHVVSPPHLPDRPVTLRAVAIPLDYKCKIREKMVRSAREFLRYASMIEDLDQRLTLILGNAIEGKPLLDEVDGAPTGE